MGSSYSELQQYRACPRRFGFQKLGYRSPKVNEPLTTGQLVHSMLAAHFKGATQIQVQEFAPSKELLAKLQPAEAYEAEQIFEHSRKRATELFGRYTSSWSKDYKAVLVEPTLELDGVVCHPDLIAFYQDKRVIVDYKTSYSPDDRWYDMSNQTDLYAYIFNTKIKAQVESENVQLIIYDIISEEGIYRHMRPPRLAAGERLFRAVQMLDQAILMRGDIQAVLLTNPHPNYTCPSRCNFFGACHILETDTWESCRDFLEENYLKEER